MRSCFAGRRFKMRLIPLISLSCALRPQSNFFANVSPIALVIAVGWPMIQDYRN